MSTRLLSLFSSPLSADTKPLTQRSVVSENVGTYNGLLDAIYLLLGKIDDRMDGEVRGRVVVKGDVYGLAYICW